MDVGIVVTPAQPGLVPEFECREAAVYVHVSWKDWNEILDSRERAAAVAHYRTQLLIKAHVEDEARRVAERARGRAARRRN